MKCMLNKLAAFFRGTASKDDGNASVEFVLVFPVLLVLFLASFETGLLMIRQVTLERAVDITVRDLRLSNIEDPTQTELRTRICNNAGLIPDCMTSILIEMRPISTTTWAPLGSDVTCKERSETLDPVVELNPGAAHEIMLVRVCAVFEPWFPTTHLGMQLHRDELGGYALVASSAFVNEPS